MKAVRLLGLLIVTAGVLAACTSPDSVPPPRGETPTIESGVTGTVLTRDGAPAVNQVVTFHAVGVLPTDLSRSSTLEVSTNSNGEYAIELPAGTYNAVALTDDDGARQAQLNVRAGEVTQAPAMKMLPLGQVEGKALYPDRDEHIGITITVPGTSFIATSDAEGSFTMRLPEGTYSFTAFQATYGHVTQDNVNVKSGETTTLPEALTLAALGPQITSVTPSVVMVGDRIEITGMNFGDLPGSIQFDDERVDFGDLWPGEGDEPFLWTDTKLVIGAYGGLPLTIIRLDGKHTTVLADDLLILGPPQLQPVGSLENCESDPDSLGNISCGDQQRRVPDIWAREALEVQPGETVQISITAQLAEYGAFYDDADPNRTWRTAAGQELSLEVSETYKYCYEADDCHTRYGGLFGVTTGDRPEPVELLDITPGLTDVDGYATVTASVVIPEDLAYFTVRLLVNDEYAFGGWVGIGPLAMYVIPEGADPDYYNNY